MVRTSEPPAGTPSRRRARGRRAAVCGLGAVVLVLAGAAGWLARLDLDRYKHALGARVEAATGRRLTVAGKASIRFWPELSLSLADVRLSNPPWAAARDLVAAERVRMRVDLLPLLHGRIRIGALSLEGVTVNAERGSDGTGSWVLSTGHPQVPSTPGGGALDVSLASARVARVRVRYRDGGVERAVSVESLRLSPSPSPPDLHLAARGTGAGVPWVLSGTVAPLVRLLRGRTYPFSLRLQAARSDLRLAGSVDPESGRWEVAVEGRIASLDAWSPLVPGALPDLPLELDARVSGAPGAPLAVAVAHARSGGSEFSGRASVARDGPRPSVRLELTVPRLDLASRGERSEPAGERVLPEVGLPWSWLGRLDGGADLTVGRLLGPELDLREVRAHAELRRGVLRIAPASARLGEGRVDLTVHADANETPGRLAVTARSADLDTASALRALGLAPDLETRARVSVALSGRGATLHGWLGAAAGHLRWTSGAGRLGGRIRSEVGTLEQAVGGLAALAGAFSAEGAAPASLNCLAADLDVTGGMARTRVLIADTRYATVVGRGSIDLARERLALRLEPSPKSVTLNVSVPVEVGGTWRTPTYTLDRSALGRRIGGVAAALLFPPAALAALVAGGADAGASTDPCLAPAAGSAAAPDPGAGGSGAAEQGPASSGSPERGSVAGSEVAGIVEPGR